jgi:hypothetical protein
MVLPQHIIKGAGAVLAGKDLVTHSSESRGPEAGRKRDCVGVLKRKRTALAVRFRLSGD